MHCRKWVKLKKSSDWYELETESIKDVRQCLVRINFVQIAYACDNERLIAIDSKGIAYYIDLTNVHPSYQKLGAIGQACFIAFNPIDNGEIIIGLTTADIKLMKIHANINEFCLISGHKLPPTNISFYKDYCLTFSYKEVIIWHLKSFSKAHQLHINTKNVSIKKASLSNLGHIVVLYHNDSIQTWMLNLLDTDTKLDIKKFGIRNIKDFVFTQNGRAMIMASTQNKIIVLNTYNWNMIKSWSLPEKFIGIKQMSIVPLPLDSGANQILAVISSNCMLYILDLNLSCFIDMKHEINNVKKIVVSSDGRYITIIDKQGFLKLILCDKLFSPEPMRTEKLEKLENKCRPKAHKINEHLQCIRQNIKQELRLDRLLLILQEFGKFPDKYRPLIWSTILKLPANKTAFISLMNNVTQKKEISLNFLKNYHLADRSKASLLTMIIDCLIQWCPLFAQTSFLPNLVFPFLMVSQKDQLFALELVLSILVNYCQKWFEYHPLPPLNILGIIENILLRADPQLLNVFCERGITSIEYAWPLLQTTMSEVLSGDEWLILWDHLLSFQTPTLFLMCTIAYSICSRNIIFMLHTTEDLKRFYRTQGHIRAKELLKVAQHLDQDVPHRLHPNLYLRNKLIQLPKKGPYPPFVLEDYPKFLTEELNISQLQKLQKQKQILQRYKQQAVLTEKKRLNNAAKAFMEEIHKKRLHEVKKSFQAQLYNKELELNEVIEQMKGEAASYKHMERKFSHLLANSESETYSSTDSENTSELDNKKLRNCTKLQRDVARLEDEVQNVLDELRCNRPTS
ncbi:TBC1 domain family member 31 [Polistes fuscatus]|uniref:TBC1 domain family member 31 n=1 Tax=Polistes fuscatus TaxID=30207 RepID=UPI001CA88B70|nr:TBC1 domain family member 31 [Polistes fuscatus]